MNAATKRNAAPRPPKALHVLLGANHEALRVRLELALSALHAGAREAGEAGSMNGDQNEKESCHDQIGERGPGAAAGAAQ